MSLSEDGIAIVGGGGFIGSALARYLNKDFKVKVLDKEPLPRDLQGTVEYHQCDIREYSDVEQGLNDVHLVIHMAIVQIPLINEAKRLGYEVNITGTQNVCKVVDKEPSIKGMILAGSWHVFGERRFNGVIDEEFGFRPDRVDDRARLYALSKIAQEAIVRFYDETSEKIYGIIRTGTVLGEGMPEKTAANIFITRGLRGESLTPFKHSVHRPMLYVDINDVCRAYEAYAKKIFNNEAPKERNSLAHVVNLCWPEPITILELARIVRNAVMKYSGGVIEPRIEIVDTKQPSIFTAKDKELMKVDISKAIAFLNLEKITCVTESIEKLVEKRINRI